MEAGAEDASVTVVVLRPAARHDCRSVWEWRNEPATRAASFDAEPVPYTVHERWFETRLADSRTHLFIVLNADGAEVGYVRFDVHDNEATVSVSIDAAFRGRGLGSAGIRAGCELVLQAGSASGVVAQVKPGNEASRSAFLKAGFVSTGLTVEMGSEAWRLEYSGPPESTRRSSGEPSTGAADHHAGERLAPNGGT